MKSPEEIAQLMFAIMGERAPFHEMMRRVSNRYDIDYVISLPDVPTEPRLPPLIPALIAEAVDGLATRAASVEPSLVFPAIDANKRDGIRSLEWANLRRRACQATYARSKWKLGRRRWYRQLTAYATGSLIVLPDYDEEIPKIQCRNPLMTYPETVPPYDLRPPMHVGFVTTYDARWLRRRYPALEPFIPAVAGLYADKWDIVEWVDEDATQFILLGPSVGSSRSWRDDVQSGAPMPYLTRIGDIIPNRVGYCVAITPEAVQLDKTISRLAMLIGNVDMQGRLKALDILAQEKAIWPDLYALGRANGDPLIVNGKWEDGRTGKMNILQDIEQIGQIRSTPDLRTQQTIDNLERAFKNSAGMIPQMTGDNYGSLRTGAALDSMAGMALDPMIQEMHELTEAWLPTMNSTLLDTYKAYWGAKQYSMYTRWAGDRQLVEFTPDVHFETCENAVVYPIAGADVVQQTQILGGMLGVRAIGLRSFRDKHPWIADPEAEGLMADEEEFEQALRAAIFDQMRAGQIPIRFSALIHRHIKAGQDIFDAVEHAEEELKQLQAQQQPPPGAPPAPDQMPGLAAGPGAMMPQGQPQVAVPGDVQRMNQLLTAMRGG